MQHMVIELQRVLSPIDTSLDKVEVVGFAEDVDVIFLWLCTYPAIFTLNFKSGRARKLTTEALHIFSIVPFTSFNSPGTVWSSCSLVRNPILYGFIISFSTSYTDLRVLIQ